MAMVAAGGFNQAGELIGDRAENQVVGRGVVELVNAEAALEAGNAVEAVVGFVFADNTPEVVALDPPLAGVAHRLQMEQRRAGKLGAKFGRDAIVIGSLVAVENHKVLGERLALVFGGIKDSFVMFGKGGENTAYAKYFIGTSYLQPLTRDGVGISNVTFEPKCRNNWHIHHKGGQILLVVAGRGWYQEWGKPAQELHPGDVVNIPPEVKHWHGAAKDSWFTHIAVAVPAEGAFNEWLEEVSDEEYDKLK